MGKVVLVDPLGLGNNQAAFESMKRAFEGAGHRFVVASCKGKSEVLEQTRDAEAIVIDNSPNLKVIVRCAIGVDILDIEYATTKSIAVCNIPDYCVEEVAVHTITLILAAERKLGVAGHLVRSGGWKNIHGYPVHRLSKQTLGIIGFGRIGRLVATYAQAFGMKVVSYDPFVPEKVFDQENVRKVGLDELYAVADVVSLNAPATKETYHIVNRDSIAKMKDGVIIVNTSRGGLLATADLIEGLKIGKIKAASLDVLEEEPLRDPGAEILKFANVVITTHNAHDSVESYEDVISKTIDSVVKVLRGELPYNVLNKDKLAASATIAQ
jgi:D-3-phosphoglycerate dehydrogenase